MAIVYLACFIIGGITATSAFDCRWLSDDNEEAMFGMSVVRGMMAWRNKIHTAKAGSHNAVHAAPSDQNVVAAMDKAAYDAAKEVCEMSSQELFVSKEHRPDLCRNVYVIGHSVQGNELVNKIVKMDASLVRYRYCPNAMKLLKPPKGQVGNVDRDLILQKGKDGTLAFILRIFDDIESKNRYVAIIYEDDKGQQIKEFMGPMNKLLDK